MQKSKRSILIIFAIGYLLGISLLIWPNLYTESVRLLEEIGLYVTLSAKTFIYYYGLVLLVITALVLIVVLFWPKQLKDVPLQNNKGGRLALSNYGISQFIKLKLSGEDLSNIKIKVKNTKRQHKFYIVADAAYKQATVKELPRISDELRESIEELLAGEGKQPVKVDIKVNQKSNSKRKTARVI